MPTGPPRRASATLRLYEELNDAVSPGRRKTAFDHEHADGATAAGWLRSLGVDPEAVDLVLVNGRSVGLDHPVGDGDRVAAYPVFEAFDVSGASRVRPTPLRRTRFLLHPSLGRLAACLRLLGFDALCADPGGDPAARARGEGRILVSRTPAWPADGRVERALRLGTAGTRHQVREILERLHLDRAVRPFTRCPRCNAPLEPGMMEAAGRGAPASSRGRSCPRGHRVPDGPAGRRRLARLLGSPRHGTGRRPERSGCVP